MNLRNKAEIFASLYSAVEYQYEVGPVSELAPNWFVEGLNCQLLIHLAYQEFFEVTLPQELRSSEMFADQNWFVDRTLSQIREGDVIFMGPRTLFPKKDSEDSDAKKLHLALVTDSSIQQGIEIIHARPKQGIVIETVEKAMRLTRGGQRPYEKIFGIKGLNF